MNPSVATSEEQGEPSWGTGSWNQSGPVPSLESDRPYAGSRLDWDWDAPMILAQHSDGRSDDRNTGRRIRIEGSMASSLRAHSGILSPGFPSNFSQNPMGAFSSSGIRSFVGMDPNSINSSGVMGSSSVTGIPGLAPTGGNHGDLPCPFEQRRRQYFGMVDCDQKNRPTDFHVKYENEICGGDGHGARIGLNLGVRTYFSTEDTAAGRLGKIPRGNSPSSHVPVCQAEGCKADLSTAKHYHRRHKVCELHSKAANVMAAGHTQRFCQQCSRFHLLCEFDEGKRSCRKRLADHNRRRRKPHPSSSTVGAGTAESMSFKTCADSNSMMRHLKKSASASSASMDDSDDKTVSAGNSLQLRRSSGLELSSQGVVFNTSMSEQDPQVLLSAVSIAPSLPLMIENGKRQPSVLPGNVQDASVYQHFLHGVSGHIGPNLSLTCLEGGLGLGNCAESYNGMGSSVPWLRATGSSSGAIQSSRRSTINLQLLDVEKVVPRSHEQLTCPCPPTTSVRPVYSSSVQNLLPGRPSRAVGGADWIVEKRDNVGQFGSCLSNFSGGELDEHQFALLENSTPVRDGFSGGGQQGQVVEFLQQHGGDVSCTGGIDMKFPELQSLRPGNFGSSVYESQSSIL